MPEESRQLDVHALLDPTRYDHAVEQLQLVETHISWVLLTGPYAYKIKKALNLGFLDFSTLARRRFFCEEEIRLNGRLAPEIYLDVVPIYGSRDAPRLVGPGTAIEYAVRMRQFPQEDLLNRLVAQDKLRAEHIDAIASRVADFHLGIPSAAGSSPFGSPAQVRAPVDENFRQILARIDDVETRERLEALHRWSDESFARLADTMIRRKSHGFIRECHGDMHLGNMALLDGQVTLFDGIEFNDDLRWIDVMSEVAFLTGDLEYWRRPDYARRFLNDYLESTGDFAGLALLRYYQAYRAMVRAKVIRIRLSQPDLPVEERSGDEREFQHHLAQAEGYKHPSRPIMVLMRGVSGSGKTVISQICLERADTIRIRSDVERKRLFGLRTTDRTGTGVGDGIYTGEASARTYERLRALAGTILDADHGVIVDATFLRRDQRQPFVDLASERNVACVILDVHADDTTLRERVKKRVATGTDASEAGVEVLEQQLQVYQPLDADEERLAIRIDSGKDIDYQSLLEQLRQRSEGGG